MVKRILREATRHAAEPLERAAPACRIDAVLRLKSEFPAPDRMSLAAFRRALRADADALLARLIEHVSARAAAAIGASR
jgi:hypothetical protein